MGDLIARLKEWFERQRRRWPLLDHVVRMVQYVGAVKGTLLAGAITYFGFLSVFPLLALAFGLIGKVSQWFPDLDDALATAVSEVFPGIITTEDPPPTGQISIEQIAGSSDAVIGIGSVLLLYTGLGWISRMRAVLATMFDVPEQREFGFVPGKLRDLAVLILTGVVLILSVSISGAVTQYVGDLLDLVGVRSGVAELGIGVLSVLLGVASGALLFFTMYKLLSGTDVPNRSLWQGALLAAVGFEILKQLASFVLGNVAGGALATFTVAVTMLVWIYYFSQLIVYGAGWAVTSRAARHRAVVPRVETVPSPGTAAITPVGRAPERQDAGAVGRAAFVGAGIVAAAWAWVRWDKKRGA
ncbi:membrane protein [Mumia flava]|uniref:Membrane protein n=1 Tax=Mumia flava TaxID=1348852 RepID=A0A2M9BKK4_9ACTN|nr:YihY/virulence factor BrkB family protein [Mumia flava]PJJ58461.1 membrane protein [Mumia flava]